MPSRNTQLNNTIHCIYVEPISLSRATVVTKLLTYSYTYIGMEELFVICSWSSSK